MSFINFLNQFFKKKNDFELHELGDISKLTCDEMAEKLALFKKDIQVYDKKLFITWESDKTIIQIRYTLDGIFEQKIKEIWKKF